MVLSSRPGPGAGARRLLPGLGLVAALLAGCAGGPGFDTDGTDPELTPRDATGDDASLGTRVVWGGRIVRTDPGEPTSRLELLAFPLDRSQRPRADRDSLGRFRVDVDGYLEPEDYRAGRTVTVTGVLRDIEDDRIGAAAYRFPVIDAEGVHLWPTEPPSAPREGGVRIGIGIGVGL